MHFHHLHQSAKLTILLIDFSFHHPYKITITSHVFLVTRGKDRTYVMVIIQELFHTIQRSRTDIEKDI